MGRRPVCSRRKAVVVAYYLLLGVSAHLGAIVVGIYPTHEQCITVRDEMLQAQKVGPSFRGVSFACYTVSAERQAIR